MLKRLSNLVQKHIILTSVIVGVLIVAGVGTTYAALSNNPIRDPGTITATNSKSPEELLSAATRELNRQDALGKPRVTSSDTTATTPSSEPKTHSSCAAILAERNASVAATDDKLQHQLTIMKAIIENTPSRNQLLGYGSDMMLSQAQLDAAFNQAKNLADDLQSQLTATKSQYQNKLWANSCTAELKTLL